MNTGAGKRLLVVWLILSAVTLVYLEIDHAADHAGVLRASSAVTTTAVVIALVKVRIIFREFMEVRRAPALLGLLTDIWVVVIGVTLLGSYFLGTALR